MAHYFRPTAQNRVGIVGQEVKSALEAALQAALEMAKAAESLAAQSDDDHMMNPPASKCSCCPCSSFS